MDAYVWIDSKTGDAMVTERDGSVKKIDLPDEMYEDLLYSKMRKMHDRSLEREFDKMFDRMQTPEAREAVRRAFNATPEEMGRAAVQAAGWIVPPQNAIPLDPIDPDELGELEMEWDDEEVTQPMGLTPEKLWQLQDEWKRDGLCPQCGHKGEWRGMACVCPRHGKFMG